MARKAGNFIQAFTEQNSNGYVPERFYIWSAISLIAACLERRVWLPWHHGNVYPNMYIFLVAGPSEGKSSAIRPANKLLKKAKEKATEVIIRTLPNQTTEAQLLDILGEQSYFTYKNQQYAHSSAYLIASEASLTFKNNEEHGLVKALTQLYDPDDFKKETVSRAQPVNIINPCINVIAGSTFFDLNAFLHKQGIMGGFASRCTFVVEKGIKKQAVGWFDETTSKKKNNEVNKNLLADLQSILKLTGGFTATEEVQETWLTWEHDYNETKAALKNEVLKAFMARKMLGMQKLMQILSVSESDDMVIKMHHFQMAEKLMDEVEKAIPSMLREGQASNTGSNEGVRAAVINALKRKPGEYTKRTLLATLALEGHDGTKLGIVINALAMDKGIVSEDNGYLTLLVDPDLHI